MLRTNRQTNKQTDGLEHSAHTNRLCTSSIYHTYKTENIQTSWTLQRVMVIMDDMRSQLACIQEAAECVLMNLSDASVKNSIENDIIDLKDKFEK